MRANITFLCDAAPVARIVEWDGRAWAEFSALNDDVERNRFSIFVPKEFEQSLRRAVAAFNAEISKSIEMEKDNDL